MLKGATVATPFCVEGDDCILSLLSLLGGDDNHTVGTTCTVKGRRGGILEHCHALYVAWVNVIDIATVGSAVHDNKRIKSGIQRTESTHTDSG